MTWLMAIVVSAFSGFVVESCGSIRLLLFLELDSDWFVHFQLIWIAYSTFALVTIAVWRFEIPSGRTIDSFVIIWPDVYDWCCYLESIGPLI